MRSIIETREFKKSEIEAVVKLAEEFINKNQLIELEKLYRRAKRELNINSQNLALIIKFLFDDQYFIEGSKLIKQDLLKNPYRAVIYKFIKEYPGVNFNTIKKYARLVFREIPSKDLEDNEIGSSGQMIYHLQILLKFKCIKKLQFKNYSLFIIDNNNDQVGIYYFLLRDNINRQIFKYLIENNSIKQSYIPDLTGLSKSSVSNRLKTLKEQNIIKTERSGKSFEIKINPDKKEIINKIYEEVENKLLRMKRKNNIIPKEMPNKLIIEKSVNEELNSTVFNKSINTAPEQTKFTIKDEKISEPVKNQTKKEIMKSKKEKQKIT